MAFGSFVLQCNYTIPIFFLFIDFPYIHAVIDRITGDRAGGFTNHRPKKTIVYSEPTLQRQRLFPKTLPLK